MGLECPRLASSSDSFSTSAWLPAGAACSGFPKGPGIYQGVIYQKFSIRNLTGVLRLPSSNLSDPCRYPRSDSTTNFLSPYTLLLFLPSVVKNECFRVGGVLSLQPSLCLIMVLPALVPGEVHSKSHPSVNSQGFQASKVPTPAHGHRRDMEPTSQEMLPVCCGSQPGQDSKRMRMISGGEARRSGPGSDGSSCGLRVWPPFEQSWSQTGFDLHLSSVAHYEHISRPLGLHRHL